ncbi:MAG: hypothetical protein ACXWKG_05035 [Limisphaerales bacterium]
MFRGLTHWLPQYLAQRPVQASTGTTDIMFAVCDHFEPLHHADKPEALRRLATWKAKWPKLIENFRDSDGSHPKHSFFYPIEQYDREIANKLSELCGICGGELEFHLHHENDTAETLREILERAKELFSAHKFLSRDKTGQLRFGFIHGDWALDNSHPQGKHCGVSNELGILRKAGCYADFTMPSAPSATQTHTINSIYYAQDTPAPKSHDRGTRARVLPASAKSLRDSIDDLLMVQGPLALNWQRRKFGLLPRIENGDLTGANPPRPDRMNIWRGLNIHVEQQPNWIFIKLYTHAGIPRNMATVLEKPMADFYQHLLTSYNDGKNYRLHFVTAREMVNIVHAAEDGHTGDAGQFRNYLYTRGAS